MTTTRPYWALLVATQHGRASARGMVADDRRREVKQLLYRANTVASPERTVALIAGQFDSDWRDLGSDLPPRNLMVSRAVEEPLKEIGRALTAIRARESNSIVVLIPADHCAAVASAWVASAREALRLASMYRNTVYLLHDKAVADGFPFDATADMCSSTVVVGTADSLIDLCHGSRPGRLVELSTADVKQVESVSNDSRQASKEEPQPVDICRIRSVEEYASLQRGDYTRGRVVGLDVRA